MYNWLLMGRRWDGFVRNAGQRPALQDNVAEQKLEVNIPWLVAVATISVVMMSLCIGLSIIGAVAMHILD